MNVIAARRFGALALSISIAGSLAGCAGSSDPDPSADASATPTSGSSAVAEPTQGSEHEPAGSPGLDDLSPEHRAEIERVLEEGRSITTSPDDAPAAQAEAVVRCAELDGERFCLNAGWTDQSEAAAQARFARAIRLSAGDASGETTGSADAATIARQHLSLTPEQREAEERERLLAAVAALDKVQELG